MGLSSIPDLEIDNEKGLKTAFWDSIHIFDLRENSDAKGNPLIKCSLTSSVMLVVSSENANEYGTMEVAGTINKKVLKFSFQFVIVVSEKESKYQKY